MKTLGTVSIVIDARMPARLLFEIIHTAAQSTFATFDLLVLHQGAWQTLRVEAPKMCQGTSKGAQGSSDGPDDAGTLRDVLAAMEAQEAQCVSADVELAKEGWAVRVQQGFGCGRHVDTVSEASYRDRMLPGKGKRACPTVQRQRPPLMDQTLDEALRQVKRLDQPCHGAKVIFHDDSTMRELGAVMLRLHSQGFTFTQLAYSPNPARALCD